MKKEETEKDGFDEMIDKYTPIGDDLSKKTQKMNLKLNHKYKIETLIKLKDISVESISIKEVYEGGELGPEIMKKKKSNKKWICKAKGETK